MDPLQLIDSTEEVVAATYVVVAAIALVACWRQRTAYAAWMLAFLVTGMVARLSTAVAGWDSTGPNEGAIHALPATFSALQGWALLRFALSATDTRGGGLRLASDLVAVLVIVPVLLRPEHWTPGAAGEPAWSLAITLLTAVGYFALAGTGVLILARHARHAPLAERARTRLALAGSILAIATTIVIAQVPPALAALTAVLTGLGLILFLVAVAPPRAVRDAWLAPLLRRQLRAVEQLLVATEPDEVATTFLPEVVEFAGARGGAILRADGRVLRIVGTVDRALLERDGPEPPGTRRVPAGDGELIVTGMPHPSMSTLEDTELLTSLGNMLGLTLRRADLIDREREVAARRTDAARLLEAANEELRSIGELKDTFVAMASHELRTPVTTIGGFTTTLLSMWDELEDSERQRFLRIVDVQARRLTALVEDLLIVSRIERGAMRPAMEPMDVAGVLESTVAERDLHGVAIDVEPGLRALGDPRYLEQVVGNLLANADKYGAPPVTVHAFPASADSVQVRVSDAGEGVSVDIEDRLFESFTRAGDVEELPGSGLGLFIVRRLAEAMGGRVWHEPTEPHGATFVVELERAGQDGPAAAG